MMSDALKQSLRKELLLKTKKELTHSLKKSLRKELVEEQQELSVIKHQIQMAMQKASSSRTVARSCRNLGRTSSKSSLLSTHSPPSGKFHHEKGPTQSTSLRNLSASTKKEVLSRATSLHSFSTTTGDTDDT